MVKNIKNSESDELAKRLQAILQLRGRWLELTGGDLMRGIDLLEYANLPLEDAEQMPDCPGAGEAERACVDAIKKWWELTRDLMGWALAATTGASAKGWHPPADNLAPRYRLIAYLREATDRAAAGDTYVIAALSKEMALKTILALQKLEYGEVYSILEPAKRKSYKDDWTIRRFRFRILYACHYCYGSGLSMAIARQRVSEFVGEHAENLRNWDRAFGAEANALGADIYENYHLKLTEYQIAGAAANGVAVEDASRRLNLFLVGSWNEARLWDLYLRRPLRWDDKYLEQLGRDYQDALKEQKKRARRRKR
jgi:hypothetical protein